MLSILIKLFVVAVGVIIVVNFLPTDIKEKALALLSSIIPNAIEEKIQETIDPIIHTPVERREKLINKLENNISAIKKSLQENKNIEPAITKEVIQQIEETEKILENIKDTNEEQSPINKVTTAVIKKAAEIIASEEKQTEPLVVSPAEPPYAIQESKTPPPSASCKWVCQ